MSIHAITQTSSLKIQPRGDGFSIELHQGPSSVRSFLRASDPGAQPLVSALTELTSGAQLKSDASPQPDAMTTFALTSVRRDTSENHSLRLTFGNAGDIHLTMSGQGLKPNGGQGLDAGVVYADDVSAVTLRPDSAHTDPKLYDALKSVLAGSRLG